MVHIRLGDLENFAHLNNVPIMQKDGIEFLLDYIKNNNIKDILEIGSAIGYSSIKMALLDPKISITTLEKDSKMYSIAHENIDKFNLNNQIEIVNVDALLYETDKKFDLIFIDAAKSQYIKFFELYEKNLKQGGAIVTDNLLFHGLVMNEEKIKNRNTKQLVRKIKKYVEYLKSRDDFDTKFYEIGDGISISIKK